MSIYKSADSKSKTFKLWAKLLAIFLSIALVATMSPLSKVKAYADTGQTQAETEATEENAADSSAEEHSSDSSDASWSDADYDATELPDTSHTAFADTGNSSDTSWSDSDYDNDSVSPSETEDESNETSFLENLESTIASSESGTKLASEITYLTDKMTADSYTTTLQKAMTLQTLKINMTSTIKLLALLARI